MFVGTRVPLRNLFDYLERGHGIDEFLRSGDRGAVYNFSKTYPEPRSA